MDKITNTLYGFKEVRAIPLPSDWSLVDIEHYPNQEEGKQDVYLFEKKGNYRDGFQTCIAYNEDLKDSSGTNRGLVWLMNNSHTRADNPMYKSLEKHR